MGWKLVLRDSLTLHPPVTDPLRKIVDFSLKNGEGMVYCFGKWARASKELEK